MSGRNNDSESKDTFCESYKKWLNQHKYMVEENTFNFYSWTANKHILPYFEQKKVLLEDLSTQILMDYYHTKMDEGLSVNTVRKHHANIHSALKYAVKEGVIQYNPADSVTLPKSIKYNASYYSLEELNMCMAAFKGHSLETAVYLASIGLRRSEVLGLTWSGVNEISNTLTVSKTVVQTRDVRTGKTLYLEKNRCKSLLSNRILVMPEYIKVHLRNIKTWRTRCGANDPVVVYRDGRQMKPDYLTRNFKKRIEEVGLRPIRFHDLRHTCATLLYNLGYDLKDIQMWLGHSDIKTTSEMYLHYNMMNKKRVAKGFEGVVGI